MDSDLYNILFGSGIGLGMFLFMLFLGSLLPPKIERTWDKVRSVEQDLAMDPRLKVFKVILEDNPPHIITKVEFVAAENIIQAKQKATKWYIDRSDRWCRIRDITKEDM